MNNIFRGILIFVIIFIVIITLIAWADDDNKRKC